jgi:nitrite reductase/ring-hydroxylating ferredoxin subunit
MSEGPGAAPAPKGDRITDRVMAGETPLQALARQGELPPVRMRSIERFPYYTAFPFAWYRACHADEVRAGGLLPLRLLSRDLVVWRGEDGLPHVMDAYCPHLGAHLGYGGRVEGCELVCPFHWWRFGADGRNTRIPYDGTRSEAARIKTYPTVDRNGMILFWYHPLGEAPLWEIPRVDAYYDDAWTDYYRTEWTIRAPWQEFAENGPDFVHLRTVHGSSDVPELESYELDGYFTHVRARVNFATPRGPQPGRIDTDSWGPGFSLARFSGIIDACFVGALTPLDFEATLVSFNYMLRKLGDGPEALERTRRVGEALIADLRKQVAEDVVIFDHKRFNAHPALSRADGPIARFRSWARRFYVDGDAQAVNR